MTCSRLRIYTAKKSNLDSKINAIEMNSAK